jgi:hypothetical protein
MDTGWIRLPSWQDRRGNTRRHDVGLDRLLRGGLIQPGSWSIAAIERLSLHSVPLDFPSPWPFRRRLASGTRRLDPVRMVRYPSPHELFNQLDHRAIHRPSAEREGLVEIVG